MKAQQITLDNGIESPFILIHEPKKGSFTSKSCPKCNSKTFRSFLHSGKILCFNINCKWSNI